MPSLISGRIYIFDVESDPRAPQIHKVTRFKTCCSQEKMKGKRVNSHIGLIWIWYPVFLWIMLPCVLCGCSLGE